MDGHAEAVATAPEPPSPPDGGDGTAPSPPATRRRTRTAAVPRRADGVELIGEMEASGFEDPPSLVRRADGQVIQLTELLFITLEAVDGSRDHQAIADEVSAKLGRSATADNVRFLLEEKLQPLGVLKLTDGSDPAPQKSNPLLTLRWKFVLSNERLTNRLTAPFAQLFRRPIVFAVVLGFVAVAAWVLLVRGLAQGARDALYSPGLLLLVFGLTVVSAGFHEFGHAAACRFGGARPGVMGAGIYLVWPAFYTDVTDAYRLGRAGRLRTDLGGLYFNAIFLLAAVGVWAVTGWEALLLVVPLQLLQMLHQLLPVVRMDGYYVLSDLTGVPDLFARIKPTLSSAVPGHEMDSRAAPLKRWVRIVVTAWVLIVVPVLLLATLMAAIALPRMIATAWDSLLVQTDAISNAADRSDWLQLTVRLLSIGALILPIAGTLYMMVRIARRLAQKAWTLGERHPAWRLVGVGALVAAVIGLAALWWPNGEYRPLQPGERGTLVDGAGNVGALGTGRPGLTPEREAELGGAPSRRDASEPVADTDDEPEPDATTPPPTPATSTPDRADPETTAGTMPDRTDPAVGAPVTAAPGAGPATTDRTGVTPTTTDEPSPGESSPLTQAPRPTDAGGAPSPTTTTLTPTSTASPTSSISSTTTDPFDPTTTEVNP